MGKKKRHDKCRCYCCCECCPAPRMGGYGMGYGQGQVAGYGRGGYGMGMGYGMGYGAGDMYSQCFAPLTACSQGVCIENGELLIAFVLLLIFLFSRDKFPI